MEGYISPSLALLFRPAKDPKLQISLDKNALLTPLVALKLYQFKGGCEYAYVHFKLFQLI